MPVCVCSNVVCGRCTHSCCCGLCVCVCYSVICVCITVFQAEYQVYYNILYKLRASSSQRKYVVKAPSQLCRDFCYTRCLLEFFFRFFFHYFMSWYIHTPRAREHAPFTPRTQSTDDALLYSRNSSSCFFNFFFCFPCWGSTCAAGWAKNRAKRFF